MQGNKNIIRPATLEDCKFIFKLRNKPYVRKESWNTKKISYKSHKKWFKKNYQYYYIIDENKGFIRVKNGEVSIAILRKFQKRGLGLKVLVEITRLFPDLKAEVKLDNTASLHCFLNAGFRPVGLLLKKENQSSIYDIQEDLETKEEINLLKNFYKKFRSILSR